MFAEALRTLIERNLPAASLTVVTELALAHVALATPPPHDLAILDLYMPGSLPFDGIAGIRTAFPDIPVVVISGSTDGADAARSIALGVRGFVPKSLPPATIAAALQVVLSGGSFVPTEYAQVPAPTPTATVPPLTPREVEVLQLLAAGDSNKAIAIQLGLSEITVKLHARNIFRKLGVHNRVSAANAARSLKL